MIQRFKLVRFYVKLGFIAKNIRSTVKKKNTWITLIWKKEN